MNSGESIGEEPPNMKTSLGIDRTRLAAERTLMAWIRTSMAMIGFGFTIGKFFQYMRESSLFRSEISGREPFYIGLALVGTGLMFLVIACVDHIRFLRLLDAEKRRRLPLTLPLMAAGLLLAIGVLALISILF